MEEHKNRFKRLGAMEPWQQSKERDKTEGEKSAGETEIVRPIKDFGLCNCS